MARAAQDVTEAELAVLDVLWQQDQATVRQISERLYPGGGSSHHATVQKLLDRLKSKHFVHRDSTIWPHRFRATVERSDLVARRLRSTANQLCDGRLQPLLSHLVKAGDLTPTERDSLRDLLDRLDPSGE
jgi:predicted transcriptional regulator